jgi:hypothetical protein
LPQHRPVGVVKRHALTAVLDAEVLPENRQMLQVFRDCGYPVKIHSHPGVELVELRTSLAAKGLKPLEPHNQAA